MSDLYEQLRDYVESTIERIDIDDVAAAASAEPTARPNPTLRRPVWAAAGAALLVILLIGIPLLLVGNGDSTTADLTPPTVPATTVAPPMTQPVPTTTPPPSPDAGEETGTAAMVTPPIEVTWTLAATVDGGWLTEPVAHNGGFLARHKALAEGTVEGWINTDEGLGGQMWESTDGVTWVPASDDQQWPPPPTDASTTGSAVIVEYEGNRATERVGRLLATSDGSTWREINLRPYEDNWVPRVAEGGLGWLVYSPPRAEGASWSAPRLSNHGLWYTPDTESWFEVANLGPLVNYGDIGEVGVWDVAMIVRDDDILVFAYMAENFGFGNGSQHRTEIWRLDLSAVEPADLIATSTPAVPTTALVPIEDWNPILSTTSARPAPPAASCPSDADPDAVGPADQSRPEARWVGNLAGAFDRHTGRIVYVDVTGETWTFDVCTDTWHRVEPNGMPVPAEALYDGAGEPSGALGRLVYDVDSDVTVSLGYDRVSVYDATTNTWGRRAYPTSEMGAGPHGGVYDPVSGLIVTSFSSPDDGEVWDLWAYNVDVDEWTELGPVTVDRDPPCCTQIDLLGYSADLDRLILVTPFDRGGATLLVDPRTGEMTIIPGTGVPVVDLGWPSRVFGQANGTVYVYGGAGRALCRFDADTLSWACHNTPAEIPTKYVAFTAITDDPINNRLTMINGVHGEWWRDATDDVWAIELSTGQWSEILAPSSS